MNDKYSPPLFVKDDTTILTNLKKGEANARYAILAVRDPLGFHDDPADVVGAYMEDVHEISRNPMYTVVSGRYKDAEIIVCSMGSGGPDAEIAILDLMQFSGCDTFIRLGTSGTQRDDLNVGDIVISSGAVRDEGLTKEYIAPQYPALSSYEVMLPMIEAAQKMLTSRTAGHGSRRHRRCPASRGNHDSGSLWVPAQAREVWAGAASASWSHKDCW